MSSKPRRSPRSGDALLTPFDSKFLSTTVASDGTHDSYQRGSGGQSAVRKARLLGLFTLAYSEAQ